MAGLFAKWQPVYADMGVPTFPVDGERKKPAVGNPLKGRCRASAQWAQKFPEANALGFACGKANDLTLLDVDIACENVLADAMAVLGPSPLVARTASGKFHAYYRHNGERRSPRKTAEKWGLKGPIDILGQGGFAIAPPSCNSLGAYEFVQGRLEDLRHLPKMRAVEPANGVSGDLSTVDESEGQRNDTLHKACCRAASDCADEAALLRFAHSFNTSGQWEPLPFEEVQRVVASAWKWTVEGRNGLAGDNFVILNHATLDVLEGDPDASYLYSLLKRHHWGRDFVIANDWRNSLPCGSWSLPRFRAARQFLEDNGLVRMVRPPIKGVGPAIYEFNSPAVCP